MDENEKQQNTPPANSLGNDFRAAILHPRTLVVSATILVLSILVGLWMFAGTEEQEPNTPQRAAVNELGEDITDDQEPASHEVVVEEVALETYTLENEGLSFQYDPDSSELEAPEPRLLANDQYSEEVTLTVGSATLRIVAGVDGIGGGPQCINQDRDACEVIDAKEGSFLGEAKIYRLVKTETATACGFEGVLPCDEVPLTTNFIIDAVDPADIDEDIYGGCCSLHGAPAKNLGGRSSVAGSLLVSFEVDESARGPDLLSNPDILEVFDIIESIRYEQQ